MRSVFWWLVKIFLGPLRTIVEMESLETSHAATPRIYQIVSTGLIAAHYILVYFNAHTPLSLTLLSLLLAGIGYRSYTVYKSYPVEKYRKWLSSDSKSPIVLYFAKRGIEAYLTHEIWLCVIATCILDAWSRMLFMYFGDWDWILTVPIGLFAAWLITYAGLRYIKIWVFAQQKNSLSESPK